MGQTIMLITFVTSNTSNLNGSTSGDKITCRTYFEHENLKSLIDSHSNSKSKLNQILAYLFAVVLIGCFLAFLVRKIWQLVSNKTCRSNAFKNTRRNGISPKCDHTDANGKQIYRTTSKILIPSVIEQDRFDTRAHRELAEYYAYYNREFDNAWIFDDGRITTSKTVLPADCRNSLKYFIMSQYSHTTPIRFIFENEISHK
jgi:hypothetical protein